LGNKFPNWGTYFPKRRFVGESRVYKMGLKSDSWIRDRSIKDKMIDPFCEDQIGKGVVSYGLSSYGYDIRVGREFKIFTNVNTTVVDPKNFDNQSIVDIETDVAIIPANSFALARTVEYFKMPNDVLAICLGKSTYARCGIIVNVTPFEPGFKGHITIEISNTTPLPAKIYANEGIAQVLFLQGDEPCEVTYADKKGKYQSQRGITLPRILK
jgi:dCTP deaminase